jgi:hypothetical protein
MEDVNRLLFDDDLLVFKRMFHFQVRPNDLKVLGRHVTRALGGCRLSRG